MADYRRMETPPLEMQEPERIPTAANGVSSRTESSDTKDEEKGATSPASSFVSPSQRNLLAMQDEPDGQIVKLAVYGVTYDQPREVFCSTNVTLTSVDLQNQTFSAEIDMIFFWKQPEILEGIPRQATWTIHDDGCSLPCDPDDLFEFDEGLQWIQQEFHYCRKTGVVEWQCQFTDTFSERMELKRFPVDRQFLNILLQGRVGEEKGNWQWLCQAPRWVRDDRVYLMRSRLGQSISDYNILRPWADFRVLTKIDVDSNAVDEQPPFKLRLRVQRYTEYYLGNIIIPMFLIVAVCFVSFVIPPDVPNLSNRLTVTITSMLSAVAYRFIVTGMLPPVNYLTWMDYYVGISFFMVSLFILENGVAALVDEHTTVVGLHIDLYFGGVLAVLWVVLNCFMVFACWTSHFRISWAEMDRKDRQPLEVDEFAEVPVDQALGLLSSEPRHGLPKVRFGVEPWMN